jgi:hypothetical protein
MATTISLRTTAPHTGTTGPSDSAVACSSEPALGSTAPTTSKATLITASIHITATLVQLRRVETSPSITFTETRCVMGEATQAGEAIARSSGELKAKCIHKEDRRTACQFSGMPQPHRQAASKIGVGKVFLDAREDLHNRLKERPPQMASEPHSKAVTLLAATAVSPSSEDLPVRADAGSFNLRSFAAIRDKRYRLDHTVEGQCVVPSKSPCNWVCWNRLDACRFFHPP